eukprot:EG_transcript_508
MQPNPNVTCECGVWTNYSACGKSCGGGSRVRQCLEWADPEDDGDDDQLDVQSTCPVPGLRIETEPCNTAPCEPDPVEPDPVCTCVEWDRTAPCSLSCGGGSRAIHCTRYTAASDANCPAPATLKATEICNEQPCDVTCECGVWTNYSACGKPCGGGSRVRQCLEWADPEDDGDNDQLDVQSACPVPGLRIETEPCNTAPCEPDPVESDPVCTCVEWDRTAPCSLSCGGGSRTIHCTRYTAASDANCPAPATLKATEICNEQPCVCDCKSWGSSGACSKTCGGGFLTSHCKKYTAASDESCPDPATITRVTPCNMDPCSGGDDITTDPLVPGPPSGPHLVIDGAAVVNHGFTIELHDAVSNMRSANDVMPVAIIPAGPDAITVGNRREAAGVCPTNFSDLREGSALFTATPTPYGWSINVLLPAAGVYEVCLQPTGNGSTGGAIKFPVSFMVGGIVILITGDSVCLPSSKPVHLDAGTLAPASIVGFGLQPGDRWHWGAAGVRCADEGAVAVRDVKPWGTTADGVVIGQADGQSLVLAQPRGPITLCYRALGVWTETATCATSALEDRSIPWWVWVAVGAVLLLAALIGGGWWLHQYRKLHREDGPIFDQPADPNATNRSPPPSLVSPAEWNDAEWEGWEEVHQPPPESRRCSVRASQIACVQGIPVQLEWPPSARSGLHARRKLAKEVKVEAEKSVETKVISCRTIASDEEFPQARCPPGSPCALDWETGAMLFTAGPPNSPAGSQRAWRRAHPLRRFLLGELWAELPMVGADSGVACPPGSPHTIACNGDAPPVACPPTSPVQAGPLLSPASGGSPARSADSSAASDSLCAVECRRLQSPLNTGMSNDDSILGADISIACPPGSPVTMVCDGDVPPVACPPTSPVLALQPLHHAKAEAAAFGPPAPLDSPPCLTVGLPCAEDYDGAEKAPVSPVDVGIDIPCPPCSPVAHAADRAAAPTACPPTSPIAGLPRLPSRAGSDSPTTPGSDPEAPPRLGTPPPRRHSLFSIRHWEQVFTRGGGDSSGDSPAPPTGHSLLPGVSLLRRRHSEPINLHPDEEAPPSPPSLPPSDGPARRWSWCGSPPRPAPGFEAVYGSVPLVVDTDDEDLAALLQGSFLLPPRPPPPRAASAPFGVNTLLPHFSGPVVPPALHPVPPGGSAADRLPRAAGLPLAARPPLAGSAAAHRPSLPELAADAPAFTVPPPPQSPIAADINTACPPTSPVVQRVDAEVPPAPCPPSSPLLAVPLPLSDVQPIGPAEPRTRPVSFGLWRRRAGPSHSPTPPHPLEP